MFISAGNEPSAVLARASNESSHACGGGIDPETGTESAEGYRMRSQEVAVYKEIQKNTEMAMRAIDIMNDKIYDEDLARQISRQSLKYSELHNQAMEQLLQAKAEPYRESHVGNLMLAGAIHYNTLLNTSTSHIAELLIKGSNQGILDMKKILNRNTDVGEKPAALAQQLIDFEEKNVERLTKYL